MSPRQILAVLRARRSLLAAVWLGTFTAAIAVGLLLPAQYSASASVVVEMKTSDPIAGIALPGGLVSNHVATQVDVIQSERVVLRALKAMHLDTDPEWKAEWQDATHGRGRFEAWLAERTQKKLDVKPSRDSSVLSLAYSSPDPDFSAAMLNAIVQAYIDTTLEMRREPARRYNEFFDARARTLRDTLEKAQARLSKYQQSHGLVATDERLDIEYARLAELSSQVVALQSNAADTRSRERIARSAPEQMDQVRNDPEAASITGELATQQNRLVDLLSRLGDRHPQVIAQRNVIAELRSRLASAQRQASGTLAGADSVARGRLAEQNALLAQQRARILALKAQRDEAMVMQRDVESAQRAYDAVLSRASQTLLESGDTQANVSVLKSASPPATPAWPKWPLQIAAGAIAGLLLAVGSALAAEWLDRRLRTADDVTQGLRLPLLAMLGSSAHADGQPELQARVVDGRARRLPGRWARHSSENPPGRLPGAGSPTTSETTP